VDQAVEEERRPLDRVLALLIALANLGERGAVVVVNRDEAAFGIEAVHLDQAVLVLDGPVDDDEDEVVGFVDLRPLSERLGVLDRERVEAEGVPEDLEVGGFRLVEIEPEELARAEQLLDVLTVEVQLARAVLLEDAAGLGRSRRARDRTRYFLR